MGLIGVRFKLTGKDFFDLYKDEDINYVQKVQDFGKIDNSYGDFSFSFSIPATVHNLGLIDFYNDQSINDPFNPFTNNNIEMWINQELFSQGQFMLNELVENNGTVVDINVQYYADVTNLKDEFRNDVGDDIKLSDLEFWTDLNHTITRDEALSYLSGGSITSSTTGNTDIDLKYPMISQDNIWHWQGVQFSGVRRIHVNPPNTGGNTDIGILNTEIRPSIKVSLVIAEIFLTAGFDYKIMFDTETYFTNLYMWIANGSGWDENVLINTFIGASQVSAAINSSNQTKVVTFANVVVDDLSGYSITANTFTVQITSDYTIQLSGLSGTLSNFQYRYEIIAPSSAPVLSAWFPVDNIPHTIINSVIGTKFLNFEIGYTQPLGFGFEVLSDIKVTILGSVQPLNSDFIVSKSVPDISLNDFMVGFLRTFNAVIWWDKAQSKYVIDHKNNWYLSGKEVELTTAIDIKTSSIFPPEFFRVYEMSWQIAEDYRNKQFADANDRLDWGFDKVNTGYKLGETHTVYNPFTLSIWQEVISIDSDNNPFNENTEIPSWQCVEPQGDSASTGVRIMYFNEGNQANQTTLAGGTYTTADAVNLELPTGKDIYNKFSAKDDASGINLSYRGEYSWEIDPLQQPPFIQSNLYTAFYNDWVRNIYNLRTRRYKKSAYLNFQQIQDINMNDTIVIEGKKYFINTMKVNFLTGRVEFDLIDWMPLLTLPIL